MKVETRPTPSGPRCYEISGEFQLLDLVEFLHHAGLPDSMFLDVRGKVYVFWTQRERESFAKGLAFSYEALY
jgi:hypothetical protein